MDSCSRYRMLDGENVVSNTTTADASTCLAANFTRVVVACSRFVYDRSEFSATLTTDLDLVCEGVERRHFLGSVMMMGLTLGSFLGGPLGEFSEGLR